MGEWEQAHAAIAPILASGRQGAATRQARYLDACIRAWQSDTAALISLANNPEYAAMRPAMYYVLWKTVAAAEGPAVAEGWKTRLFAEFPRSPESRIAASEIAAPGAPPPLISVRPSPLWLLLPGRDGFTLDTSAAGVQAAARAIAPPAPRSPAPETKTLQTGLFSGEANARAQMRRLTDAGFSPALGRRAVNGAEYWAVTVPAGGDVNRTIMELKNAGFESFPWE
jgi:hypothetical protein